MNANILKQSAVGGVLAVLLLAAALPATAQTERSIEQRLTTLERKLDSGTLTRMLNQFGALQQDVQRLNGRIAELQRRIQQLEKRQRSMYQDMDNRLRQIGQGDTASGGPTDMGTGDNGEGSENAPLDMTEQSTEERGQTPKISPENAGGTATSGKAGGAPTQNSGSYAAYQSAFETLNAGRYDEASKAFTHYLQRYPDGEYADNARYWLGETHYVVREFDQALTAFQQVLDDYPNSTKRADALLKIGYIRYEQGQLGKARTALRRVIDNYPDSSAAKLAQQRLEQMGG